MFTHRKPNDVKRTESQSKNVDRERSVRLFPVSRRRLEMPQLRLDHPQRVGERQNQKPSSQLVRKAPFHGSRFTEEMEVPPRLSGAPLPGKPKLVVLVPGQSMPVSKEGSESESASSRYHRALETEEVSFSHLAHQLSKISLLIHIPFYTTSRCKPEISQGVKPLRYFPSHTHISPMVLVSGG